jgi:hypothetical protein
MWAYCVAYGSSLGAFAAAITAGVSVVAGADLQGAAIVALYAGVVGGAFGFIVGNLVGIAFGLLITFGEPRLGVRRVATLMPLTAMLVTQPFTFAIFRLVSTPVAILMAFVDAVFTIIGALLIARQYRKLAPQNLCVH